MLGESFSIRRVFKCYTNSILASLATEQDVLRRLELLYLYTLGWLPSSLLSLISLGTNQEKHLGIKSLSIRRVIGNISKDPG